MKKLKFYSMFLLVLVGIWMAVLPTRAGNIYTSPYVTFSPNGKAWTTDAGNQDVEWYAADGSDDVVTGVKRTLDELQTGEHYYSIQRSGAVPVARWWVHTSAVNCCHNAYPASGKYHGIDFAMQTCFRPHFSAWRPICADCGQAVVNWNFYMSKETAASLSYLEMGEDIYYYYLCPFNKNLETGTAMGYHSCLDISANRYKVVYMANAQGESYSGYMAPSYHMYDNATEYEDRSVTPRTHLSLNTYGRIGWEFAGWNTEADGSGISYADGEEILNLCEADYEADNEKGTVHLYAMWRPSESVLEIDAGDGTYAGKAGITAITGKYGTSITVDSDVLIPPAGYRVSFDTCGGEKMAAIRGNRYFVEWKQEAPFYGKMEEEVYHFQGPDGSRDRITAVYKDAAIILPRPVKENSSFGGWYYDADYTKPVGDAGVEYIPSQDVTLYAQWVQLILSSEENYEVNEKAGAVDLQWEQKDGISKSYKIYQCLAGQDWEQVYEADDIKETTSFSVEYGCDGKEQQFVVPHTGFYHIEAHGAQGGSYGEFAGGYGGLVQGSFWLEKGQKVSCFVGGSAGCNGGGIGKIYANGGGYTVVSTEEDGILLLAGGGGGAGSSGNGGAGGLKTSLTTAGHNGENGGAGGGGGYLGGRAGELIVHNHVEGICNHVHTGNSSEKGGCYTKAIACGQDLIHTHTRTEYWTWGGSDEIHCPNCGADATKGEDCTGHSTEYYSHDCPVHGKQESNTDEESPSVCTVIARYGLTCGQTEEYICGYPYDGYVISSKPAYGGSSYINVRAARSYKEKAGARKGNGYLLIKAEDIGYQQATSLAGVNARDMAAPKEVSLQTIKKVPLDEKTISVQWTKPQDLGTVYYHKAESYPVGSDERLSVSNITANTLVSEVKGYLYRLDRYADTEVRPENGQFVFKESLSVMLTETNQYLHIKVVDYAGNYSETVHIPVGNRVQGSPKVLWPILTKQPGIADAENVYRVDATQTYYVKCDGKTPFALHYEAYMQGPASEQYQINYATLEVVGKDGENIRNTVYVPNGNPDAEDGKFTATDLQFESDGEGYLHNGNYVVAERSSRCANLSVLQELIPDVAMHGKTISVIPVAGAESGETIVYSDYEKDKQNMLWIVGDGEAPVISGLEVLEELPVLDRRKQDVYLQLSATDELSGVRDFYLEIENLDNGAYGTYRPDESGVIEVDICEDIPIFSGDIIVTVCAIDNVGNEQRETYGTTEFDLQVRIERMLTPHDPIFKRGESGYLYITSWGYAERIEIEFPETLVAENPYLNHVYEYELKGSYMQEEQYSFMIPLVASEGTDYTVTVRAYKGDKMLEKNPAFAVLDVSGTVLDEIRTRLR